MSEISKSISRRNVLAATAASGVLVAATMAQAAETIPEPQRPGQGGTDPGPRNVQRDRQNPHMLTPPATDQGTLPNLRFSFSDAHTRITAGGWTRQVTARELGISKNIAGVDMRLNRGSVRELHWHKQAEWAYVTLRQGAHYSDRPARTQLRRRYRRRRSLVFPPPPGYPHSIQGLDPDGTEFLLVFDDGDFDEDSTFLLSDWVKHIPPEVLAKNFGVPATAFAKTPEPSQLYIFPAAVPGPLASDKIAGATEVPQSFSHRLMAQTPIKTKSGSVRIADSKNFPVSKTHRSSFGRGRARRYA